MTLIIPLLVSIYEITGIIIPSVSDVAWDWSIYIVGENIVFYICSLRIWRRFLHHLSFYNRNIFSSSKIDYFLFFLIGLFWFRTIFYHINGWWIWSIQYFCIKLSSLINGFRRFNVLIFKVKFVVDRLFMTFYIRSNILFLIYFIIIKPNPLFTLTIQS